MEGMEGWVVVNRSLTRIISIREERFHWGGIYISEISKDSKPIRQENGFIGMSGCDSVPFFVHNITHLGKYSFRWGTGSLDT